jgi:hypothetical protein
MSFPKLLQLAMTSALNFWIPFSDGEKLSLVGKEFIKNILALGIGGSCL